MPTLSKEISAYERMKTELEVDYLGKWALVHDEILVGKFDTFEDAADHAVANFGRGPYLIREIGSAPITLPISVVGRSEPRHGSNR
ncbi:MAG: hypothetical protein OXG05_12725 [Gammaproteobacteria bacterium]|nr:hypothetical protein [Gammaproteobacteria bacterium]